MADTPNMSLPVPVVGETLGPEWAEQLNDALETIDEHDHTDGKGVAIPTAGLNINADLPINGFAITEANAISLQAVVGTPDNLSVYSSGGELFYRDINGTAVPITNNGAVDAGVGNISGLGAYTDVGLNPRTSSAAFRTLALDFSFFYDTGLPSAINVGDIRLFPYDGVFTANANAITLKSPAALASNYTLTLPTALPVATSFVQVSSTGQLLFSDNFAFTSPIRGALGAASTPAFSFSSDTNTGMYASGSDELLFSTNGTLRLTLSTTGLTSTLPVYVSSGTAALPAFTFSADANTGLYLSGTDTLSISTGGTLRVSYSTTTIESSLPYRGSTGSAAAPSISFTGDTDVGLYLRTTNQLGFSTAGVERLYIGTGTVTTTLPIYAPGISTDGGGEFKVKVITVGTSSSSSAIVSTSHGLTLANIRHIGCTVYDATLGFSYSNGYDLGGGSVIARASSINVIVEWDSLSTNSKTAYAVITYV